MAEAKFSWASGADAGLGVVNGLASWANADSKAIVADANAAAANTVRTAQNQQKASALSLAATVRGIATKNALANAGEQANAATELLARTQKSWTTHSFDQGLRDMEHLGAFSASAAARGVGGSSVQAMSYSVRLQQSRLAEQVGEQQGQMSYEILKARSGIMPAAQSRLDISPLTPNFDYNTNSPTVGQPNLLAMLTEGLLTKSKSLQTALDSIPRDPATPTDVYARGDFTRMDRASFTPFDMGDATTAPVSNRYYAATPTPLAPITID